MSRRAAVALLALPLALAACGGGAKKTGGTTSAATTAGLASPLAVVQSAAEKTAGAGSETMILKATAKTQGQQVTISGNGGFDTKNKTGSMHLEFAAGAVNTSIDEVMSGTTVYLKSPLFSAMLPAGKKWLKIDLQKAGKSAGLDVSALMSQDPTQALTALKALKGATKVADEQLPSGPATHYRATIDASKLPAAVKAKGLSAGSYDVWIGGDGYVHRVRTTISGGTTGTATVTVDLADFGKSVSVTVPPASEIAAAGGSIPGLGG